MKGRAFRFLFGLLVAGIFLFMFLRRIEPGQLLASILSIDAVWLAGAFVLLLLGYAARIARWRQMLALDNSAVGFSQCMGPFMASYALNNMLPFRLGDVARSFAFSAQLGVSPPLALATLLAERLLDLLMILLLLGAAIEVFGVGTGELLGVSAQMLVLLALCAFLLLMLPRLLTNLLRVGMKLLARFMPVVEAKVAPEIERAGQLLEKIAGRNLMAGLLAWSGLVWCAEGGVYFCLAQGLSSLAAKDASWLALPVGTLATLIPSTPGYVGTFDYFTTQAMYLSGNTLASASAYALLVHIMLWLPVTALGCVYLVASPVRCKPFSKELKI